MFFLSTDKFNYASLFTLTEKRFVQFSGRLYCSNIGESLTEGTAFPQREFNKETSFGWTLSGTSDGVSSAWASLSLPFSEKHTFLECLDDKARPRGRLPLESPVGEGKLSLFPVGAVSETQVEEDGSICPVDIFSNCLVEKK